ncbi:hypothetical protein [Actinocorallia sp. A-T 12471]|uniref:hypothetical protein n=1 Tax=Actinocorallia sp. A-T 12471 TaxID=3089813 RepID=UPI0029CFF06F|nr:hypothetical protein [Actinocorallia sp. A-T 12471]MDX6738203.1 hypothetical protein [Actinocorallia sp. A-T 12471]
MAREHEHRHERGDDGRDRTARPDLGDDDQQYQTDLLREYEENPPRDLVITDEDRGEIGITAWVRRESRTGERPPDDRPAEEAAIHVESREHHAPRDDDEDEAGKAPSR